VLDRDDFDPAEWQLLCHAPTYVGLVVATAQRGGRFWEVLEIGQTYSVVRAHHGASQTRDEICAERPLVERAGFHSAAEQHGLQHIRAAVDLITAKGG
jgi:hypothetical protein